MNDTGSSPKSSGSRGIRGFTRRRFIVALSALAGALALMALSPVVSLFYRKLDRVRLRPLRRLAGLELDPGTGVGALTGDEMRTVVALGDALYPSGYASEGPFGEAVRRTTEEKTRRLTTGTAGYLDEFRTATRFLDAACHETYGSTFAAASLDQRRALLDEELGTIVPAGYRAMLMVCLLPSGRRRWRIWRYVCAELLMGFYRSSLGWRVVGYPEAPGTCSGLEAYQHPATLEAGRAG